LFEAFIVRSLIVEAEFDFHIRFEIYGFSLRSYFVIFCMHVVHKYFLFRDRRASQRLAKAQLRKAAAPIRGLGAPLISRQDCKSGRGRATLSPLPSLADPRTNSIPPASDAATTTILLPPPASLTPPKASMRTPPVHGRVF
jgi:hypothetical protein